MQCLDGFLRLVAPFQQVGHLDPRIEVQIALFRNPLELLERFVIGLELAIGRSEIIAHPVVLRIAGEHQVEFCRRPVEIASFEGDQANLDARFPWIGFHRFELLELREGFGQFILADIQLAKALAGPDVLRIDLEEPLIRLYGILGFAFELIYQREVHQYRFGFRIEFKRLPIALFRRQV